MNRRFPEHDPRLDPYVRARWVDGTYSPDPFTQERSHIQKTGEVLDRWAPIRHTRSQRRDYTGLGPRGWRRQDEHILEDVCHALQRHSEVDASQIEVQCTGCEVTLSGWVTDRYQKRMAEQIAEDVRGVTDVHNRLRVQDVAQTPSSGEISTESTVSGTTRATNHGGMPGVY